MRIALFGGTFDPVHSGHMEIARAAADRCRLDRILFVPSGRPPHKDAGKQAPYQDRLRMVEIACAADPRFEASRLEDPDALGAGKTYSVDTIERVLQTLEASDQLFFLMGEDAFRELDIWHRLDDVVRLVEFIVVTRPGEGETPSPIAGVRAHWVRGVRNSLSATEIRGRLADGEELGQVLPAGVGAYIREHGLYRSIDDASKTNESPRSRSAKRSRCVE